jgi:hypothetical protein
MFLSKYSLDRNNIIFSMFHTQYTPYFFVADHYGWRNTTSWWSEDLASGQALLLAEVGGPLMSSASLIR